MLPFRSSGSGPGQNLVGSETMLLITGAKFLERLLREAEALG
jgi:hypothetical protein